MKPNLETLLELDFLREDQIKDFNNKDHSLRTFQILLFKNNKVDNKVMEEHSPEYNKILKDYLQAQVFLSTTKISVKDYLDFKNGLFPYGPLNLMPQTFFARKKMEQDGLSEINKVYEYVMGCPLSRLYDEWIIISDRQE